MNIDLNAIRSLKTVINCQGEQKKTVFQENWFATTKEITKIIIHLSQIYYQHRAVNYVFLFLVFVGNLLFPFYLFTHNSRSKQKQREKNFTFNCIIISFNCITAAIVQLYFIFFSFRFTCSKLESNKVGQSCYCAYIHS